MLDFKVNFINGAKIEIISDNSNDEYLVKFIDNTTQQVHYESSLKNGYWASPSIKYFIEWKIEVYDGNNKIYEYLYDASNQKVLIYFDSKALGDTISWFPFLEEFQKKHKCKIVASTYHNYFFEKKYPNFKFIPPGYIEQDIYAQYNIGWFYNKDKTINYNKVPINFKLPRWVANPN